MKSSRAGEASHESSRLGGAVFTHYFMTALKGAGDRDRNREVSLDEAYQYAYRQTVQRSAAGPGNVMHPCVNLDIQGAGALVVTQTRKNKLKSKYHNAPMCNS